MMLSLSSLLKCILCCSVLVQGRNIREEILNKDVGANVTLPCHNSPNEIIKWERQGRISKRVLPSGDLFLNDVQKNDSGLYQCSNTDNDEILSKIRLNVHTPPAALEDVTVKPSTVYALIRWRIGDDGGYPITNITISYKEVDAVKWHFRPMQPTSKKVDVFELKPNSSYVFQVWASNKLGRGEMTSVTAKTLHDNQEIELARRFLQGVETFDARVWLVAVAVMMTALLTLTMGMCLVICCDWRAPSKKPESEDDPEMIELIPNIIVNPGCNADVSQYSQCTDEDDDEDLTTVYFACRNGAKAIDV